jgi:ribose-phosphate pyrophosphokinase
VADKEALIFDDEIATGGSIREAVRVVRSFGAKRVRVGATHPVLSGSAIERLNDAEIDELVLCDTIPISPPKAAGLHNLHVLSTAQMFGEAILRIHGGRSISQMMEYLPT